MAADIDLIAGDQTGPNTAGGVAVVVCPQAPLV
jgi:hypothetical protein